MRFHFPRRFLAPFLALALVASFLPSASAADLSLSMSESSASLRANQTLTLEVQVSGDDSTTFPNTSDSKIIWTSDNQSAIPLDANEATNTVGSDGKLDLTCKLTGGSAGTANVTANCFQGSTFVGSVNCIVTVQAAAITLSRTSINMNVGDRQILTASAGENFTPIWEDPVCEPADCISLDSPENIGPNSRQVFARAPGKATVYVSTSSGEHAYCSIVVTAPDTTRVTGIQIVGPSNPYIDPEGTLSLKTEVTPSTALDQKVFWNSSDRSVATVDTEGKVTGVAPGKTTITATTSDGGFKDEYEVQVSGIRLEKSSLSVYVNRSVTITYECFGSAVATLPTWTVVNPSIASLPSSSVGRVTGNYPGTTEVKATAGKYEAVCSVTVEEDVAQVISTNLGSSGVLRLSEIQSTLNSRSLDKADSSLSYVYGLEVSPEQGHLYYKYNSPASPGHGVGAAERYYASPGAGQDALADVVFAPQAGFNGTAEIRYTGVGSSGLTFSGTIAVSVTSSNDLTYSTGKDQPVSFRAEDFTAVCQARTGHGLGYVTFSLPAASRGTLYYNYAPNLFSQKVDTATRYYAASNPSLGLVSFLPASGYVGAVDVGYRYTDSSGTSHSGTIRIQVGTAAGSSSNTVEYSTGVNQRVSLETDDFNRVSRNVSSTDLRSIRFESLPVTSVGILYLDYNSNSSRRVTTSTNYYRSSSPRISNISFVPASGYAGDVTIPFTGTTTSGGTFTSSLVFHIGGGSGSTIHYSTAVGQPVGFQVSDFNSACRQSNGTTLNRVRFTLPSASAGTLYANYINVSNTGNRVSSSNYYYRAGSPALSGITFVPASGFSGDVTIPFDGYDDSGVRFDGTVTVTVGRSRDSRTVTYSTTTGGVVRFDAADFNDACRNITGGGLNYVRFDLPSSRSGTLYYQYSSSNRTGSSVSSSTSYYRTSGSRLLNDVYFVASSSTGTTSIRYTGYNGAGESYTGWVEISVTSPVSSAIRYTGSSAPITLRTADFQNACRSALGNSLNYIQFTSLPGAGRLYVNYSSPSSPGTSVTTGTRYYTDGSPSIGQISYVPKAGQQGLVFITYTGYDVNGGSHSNTVEVELSNSYSYSSFSDVNSGWDWAKPSIEFLRLAGVTNGYSNGQFRPGRPINRGEFTLMICRAFGFNTAGGNSGFPDVPANSVYAGAVATARNLGIVQGNNGRFQPTSPITRQGAMTMICRAMSAAGQAAPSASTGILNNYTDGARVATYAKPSVASLIQLGAVQGTSDHRLKPTEAISRAEMAVILHRVLAR